MAGWIKLYRDIQAHWIWEDPQKLKWWLDLVLMANHKDKKALLGNEFMYIKRGCFHTSEVKLGERWSVDRKTVRRFLELLEMDNMILTKKGKRGTTVKINNYNAFQDVLEGGVDNKTDNSRDNSEDRKKDTKVPHKSQIKGQEQECKELKNEKNSNLVTIQSAYEATFGSLISPFILDELASYLEQMDVEVIVLALQEAAMKDKRDISYVKGILNKCVQMMIKTGDDFKLSQKNHKSKKDGEKGATSNTGNARANGQDSKENQDQFEEYMVRNGIRPTFDETLPY